MKHLNYVFLFLICTAFATQLQAQEFSSSLGGGGAYTGVRRTMYTPRRSGGSVARPVARKQVRRKKTVVKYEPAQVDLTDEQMEKLMPMIKRIQDKVTKRLEVVSVARSHNIAFDRQYSLGRTFKAYTPNLIPDYRQITGNAVINSNDNTVEFIEYY